MQSNIWFISATIFTDTKCTECNMGLTYSPSDSYESCIPCTKDCPNGTHIKYSCNRTNNIVCEKDEGTVNFICKILILIEKCLLNVPSYKHKQTKKDEIISLW